ncbi:RidA family protein [Serratia fonticola]
MSNNIKKSLISLFLTSFCFLSASSAMASDHKNKLPCGSESHAEDNLKSMNIKLPSAPAAVGYYMPYVISQNKVYINQIALNEGKIRHPGIIGKDVNELQAIEETKQTVLNILAVLKEATGNDLNRVKQVVQLTGYFNADDNYMQHAEIMNAASSLMLEVFGERGKHTRATIGAKSLPLNSSVEIQAIFELCD